MRLLEKEIAEIKAVSQSCFGEHTQVYLFGSRVDDKLKGGDIDLFVIPANKMTHDEIRKERIRYLVKLKTLIGEQKIDLVISRDTERAIEIEALKTGVAL